MRTRAQAADPTAVDVPFISSTFGVPEPDLQTLIDAPTAQLVKDFLQSLGEKAQEFDVLRAEKLKADVELENIVRTSDSKVKAQKVTVTRQSKEIEELRTKVNEVEGARESLASELDRLRSSSSGSTLETQALRHRIESLESSNRDALALVESKSTEKDRVANELSEQHSKLLTLRREVGQLEERNQALENAASAQKFKEQSLQQELELLKHNNEWHANELETRGQEHAKFRKERNARIATLQRELEDTNANVDTLKRTETTLRKRLDELQTKADDAVGRIATLQDESARKEQDFRTEIDSTKRLADLQAQNAATHKARLQEVQTEVDQLKDEAASEIGHLQAEIETSRSDREHAERRVAELELAVEKLDQQPRYSRPTTPMANGAVNPATPMRQGSRAGSPSAIPGSMRKSIGNLSYTKLTTDLNQCQQELLSERRRTEKLSNAVDELINELEARKPELEEMHSEQRRLENEILEYTKLLDEANETRAKAVDETKHWHGEAEASAREGQILRQQLRDLSAQIKMLLVEIQSRDAGLAELSAEERLELERAARGDLDDDALDDMTSTGRLISERLVIFRGVSDMQARNESLLRLTRELGDRMEGEEAREKARQSAADAQEVAELRQLVSRYKDELQATATQIDSYMKERDMFRRMLQHRGQIAPDADMQAMFGQSVVPATPGRVSLGPPATPRSKDVEDLNKVLKEQQAFFDQYRNESSTDRRMLKEQVDALARDKSQLQTEVVRAQSQLMLASERYDMLQSNYTLLRGENSELQRRSQQLAENAAKQDLRTQQVAEELVEARSMADSLRNENANAKAEKDLWKRIEARLVEDNKSLVDERSRLNKLVADLQNLQNERELTDSETRRRLQGRVEGLESELGDAKKKLEAVLEESRKAVLRRDYEESQNRTRIDDLVKSLGNVREELVAVKTTKDQLQSRVDELKIELRAAEEKVAALQPRPTPRAPAREAEEPANGEVDDLPTEQRLALEISELRRDLDLAKADLESSRQQIEQFRTIAQSTEEELANFTETADQYKEDSERLLEEKETRNKELQQQIEDINTELSTTNTELSELRAKAEDGGRLLAEQKASFEIEMSRLHDDAERYTEERKLYQEDLKAQAEIAQQAQQSYENELVKHADAARSLHTVRKEFNDLRTEVAGIRAEAEAAKASLERGEESWSEQRDRFEHELAEIKRRRQDVDDQNKLLHQQMESFSGELSALRQGRSNSGNVQDESINNSSPASDGDNKLQGVIKFLRREKEIVDVQYELSIQESKRLQQQLEYANSQLEEAREKLVEERRQSADRTNAEGSTNKLMQTINELNLFRESSVTLRNESRQARERLEEKSNEVERLLAEIEPLKGRVIELEGELETNQGNMKLLQDDRDHWRQRTQNIISKYDRVDPAELEEMKKRLEVLTAEKERLETEHNTYREQAEGFEAKLEIERQTALQNSNERLERMKNQAKEQNRRQREKIADLSSEKDALSSELENAKSELALAISEVERAKAELEEARTTGPMSQQIDEEEGQVSENQDNSAQGEDHATRISEAEANASEQSRRADGLTAEVQLLQARIQELEAQVAALQQQLVSDSNHEAAAQDSTGDDVATLEKLREELATAQREVETLRNNAIASATDGQTVSDSEPAAAGTSSVAEQVAEQVAQLRVEMENQHELARKQMEDAYAQKVESLKEGLRRQLRENERPKLRQQIEAEVSAEHAAELQKLKEEHEAAIQKLKESHAAEVQRLSQDSDRALAKSDAVAADVNNGPATAEGISQLTDVTEAQVREMLKVNLAAKTLVSNSIRSNVDKQTEKLRNSIAEKDAEIAGLKKSLENLPASGNNDDGKIMREDLENQLEVARKEKDAAVRQAVENAEKKAKVQLSQRDILQAKIAVIKKAVSETPEKSVKEVWDVADKAKPLAKVAPPAPAANAAAATPASANPAIPTSPVLATPASATQTPEQIEAEKLRARQERFGTGSAQTAETPGQPSSQSAGMSFGQPSQTGTLRQLSRGSPNPQAPEFTPGSNTSQSSLAAATNTDGGSTLPRAPSQSGIPQPGGGASRLPRAPGARQSSISGGPGPQIQGNTAAQQPGGNPRGGMQSGLPRGGRGGRGGGRGGQQANAGQKRQHDGGDGGDGKRMRGGGPSAST